MSNPDPFRWRDAGGLGLQVDLTSSSIISHEVMYEDELTRIKEHPVFLGAAIPEKRFLMIGIMVFSFLILLFARAFWMQVVQGATYQALAENNRLRHDILLPKRGVIRDRNGVILAENIPSFDVRAVESGLPLPGESREELFGSIGRSIGMTVGEIEAVIASSTDPDESVVLKRDVPYDRALAVTIIASQSQGITVVVGSKRRYPESGTTMSLSHLLGYVGGISKDELAQKRQEGYRQVDLIGKTGIEASYESLLRGVAGERVYEVDSRHRITAVVGQRTAVDGTDVRLSLDVQLQRAAETSLATSLASAHASRGAVVAMDPRDGSILALVSWPSYDNNLFTGSVSSTAYRALIENPDHPMMPRAWSGTYPSGSTIKPVIALAGLAEGVISPKTTVLSVGGIQIGPWFFPDWKAGGHGTVNVRSAIAWSVNTFFYYLGGGYNQFIGLGVDRLTEWMRKFGLGSKTGIDIPGESAGFVPSQEWKEKTKSERWFIGDTYNLSIGQGDLLVTPLQVASYTATIANGGHPVTPHLKMDDTRRSVSTSTTIAPPEAVQTVRLGMRDTVVYGSGRALAALPIPVAGKTGTAQWRSDKPNHAWFTSFAPFEKPEIVVTVLLEEGVEGSSTAVPVARDVLNAWIATRGAM